ncbi:MAG TPA: hypothetical protein VGI12_05130 [Vicinamibacterales bacterium]|jgi:hypothetical protein
MSGNPGLADLVLARLAELLQGQRRVLEGLRRIEGRLKSVAEDTDALDRYNRPYGDGARLPRGRRRGC